MMWNALAFGDGQFVRGDGQAPIELHGIAVDDFAIDGLSEGDCEGRFAGAGCAEDADQRGARGFAMVEVRGTTWRMLSRSS